MVIFGFYHQAAFDSLTGWNKHSISAVFRHFLLQFSNNVSLSLTLQTWKPEDKILVRVSTWDISTVKVTEVHQVQTFSTQKYCRYDRNTTHMPVIVLQCLQYYCSYFILPTVVLQYYCRYFILHKLCFTPTVFLFFYSLQ